MKQPDFCPLCLWALGGENGPSPKNRDYGQACRKSAKEGFAEGRLLKQ